MSIVWFSVSSSYRTEIPSLILFFSILLVQVNFSEHPERVQTGNVFQKVFIHGFYRTFSIVTARSCRLFDVRGVTTELGNWFVKLAISSERLNVNSRNTIRYLSANDHSPDSGFDEKPNCRGEEKFVRNCCVCFHQKMQHQYITIEANYFNKHYCGFWFGNDQGCSFDSVVSSLPHNHQGWAHFLIVPENPPIVIQMVLESCQLECPRLLDFKLMKNIVAGIPMKFLGKHLSLNKCLYFRYLEWCRRYVWRLVTGAMEQVAPAVKVASISLLQKWCE